MSRSSVASAPVAAMDAAGSTQRTQRAPRKPSPTGDTARAGEILAQLEHLARDRYVSSCHMALAHTALGNREGALALLDRALVQRGPAIINVGVDPRFESLGSDPRYQALVERLGLPD